MPRWIDVPAHRVLEIDDIAYREEYEAVNADGHKTQFGQFIYRVIRKSDGKLFQIPRYHYDSADLGRKVYLEEI